MILRTLCAATWLLLAPALASGQAATDPEAKLAAMGITLPTPAAPIANYVRAVRVGNLVFTSGHGPCGTLQPDQKGKLGASLTIEQGAKVAQDTGICLLATLKSELGSLSRVKRIVKVPGDGQRHPDIWRPTESHERLLRPHGGGVWRARPSCAVRRRDGLAAR